MQNQSRKTFGENTENYAKIEPKWIRNSDFGDLGPEFEESDFKNF